MALKWAQGEVGVSIKKNVFFSVSPHTHKSSGNNLLPLLTSYFSFNMVIQLICFKLSENALIVCADFSLSDCHFHLEKSLLPTVSAQLEPCCLRLEIVSSGNKGAEQLHSNCACS